ncbi:hypothetical protein BDL97_16G082500 [Sphagnum fallax]|nr:hypothetical protein BDL97_16G082500 [Sphagnum fallax]
MTISLWELRGVEGFEPEDKPWDFALPPSIELDGQGNLLSEEHDSGPTKLLSKEHDDWDTDLDRLCADVWSKEKQMSSGYTYFTVINATEIPQAGEVAGYEETGLWNTYSNGAWEFRATYVCIELRLGSYPFQKFRVTPRKYSGVTIRIYDTKDGIIYKYTGLWNTYSNGAWEFRATYVCIELRLGSYPFQKFRVTPRKYSGVTIRIYDTKDGIIYKYTGLWNTYSNGAWEFRATYVCIELRLGSYPFQKFRVTPRKYSGVTTRTYDTKNGIIYKYEPWVRFKKDKFYFQGQTTAERAARICDVAKFCLKIKGRKGYNFGDEQYTYLSSVQEFLPQQSDNDIKRLVLEYAKPFLNEVQVSEEVPIVDQPPCVEPARFANGEDNTIQGRSAYVDMLEAFLLDDTNEQTADMIEEPVSPNPDIAGPTIEENIREYPEALISSGGPLLIQPKGTSKITLIAPCNGTGGVDLFTKLKVFRKEKWVPAVVNFGPESYAHEGCSASMHKFVTLQKSGDIQELSWSVEMEDKLAHFENHGWKIQL